MADFWTCLIKFLVDTFVFIRDNIAAFGVLSAFGVYVWQLRVRRREAAALIIVQIEDLKERFLHIKDISSDDSINEIEFYETLDFLADNQWEKYKHLFVNKMDSYSFRMICKFYDSALSVREQILFVKQLQRQHYFNIQTMLDTNCNNSLNELLIELVNNNKRIKDFLLSNIPSDENSKNLKEFASVLINSNNSQIDEKVYDEFWYKYNIKKGIIRNITNGSPYINYIPKQVSLTFNKAIKDFNSIEIIGSEGFRVLKKYSKMK